MGEAACKQGDHKGRRYSRQMLRTCSPPVREGASATPAFGLAAWRKAGKHADSNRQDSTEEALALCCVYYVYSRLSKKLDTQITAKDMPPQQNPHHRNTKKSQSAASWQFVPAGHPENVVNTQLIVWILAD